MSIKQTLEARMQYRIKRGSASVYVPSDFFDLSDRDQVGRVLRKFVKEGLLIKLGPGIFARARKSTITGTFIPEKNLQSLAVEALKKRGVKILPTRYERDYNAGKTTQVPTGLVIGVNKRVNRTIAYNGKTIKYEQVASR